jgi:hypothetical protein
VDESLCKDVNDDKIKVRKLIEEYENKNTTLIKIYKNKHGNMFDSILTGFDLLSTFCDYLMTIDSDTIHKKDWIIKSLDTYNNVYNDVKHNNILLSGFNTTNLGTHKVINEKNKYVIKSTVGGCHMFIHSDIYYKYIRHALISHKWDTNITNIMKNVYDSIIVTTKPSVIEHIGFKSSGHRNNDIEGKYDIAVDF